MPVWGGSAELAWRLRGPDAAPWLVVTGTNGKTTTTLAMLACCAAAAAPHRCRRQHRRLARRRRDGPVGYDVPPGRGRRAACRFVGEPARVGVPQRRRGPSTSSARSSLRWAATRASTPTQIAAVCDGRSRTRLHGRGRRRRGAAAPSASRAASPACRCWRRRRPARRPRSSRTGTRLRRLAAGAPTCAVRAACNVTNALAAAALAFGRLRGAAAGVTDSSFEPQRAPGSPEWPRSAASAYVDDSKATNFPRPPRRRCWPDGGLDRRRHGQGPGGSTTSSGARATSSAGWCCWASTGTDPPGPSRDTPDVPVIGRSPHALGHWGHGRRRQRRRRARQPGRHRPPRSWLRVVGHVPRLRPAGRGSRRPSPTPAGTRA